MAKKNGSDNEAPGIGHNGTLSDKGKEYVERIENVHKSLASLKGTYMADCKGYREDIAEILEEAKSAGIPKRAIKAVVKARDLDRKAKEAREDLDIADRGTFDNIVLALGPIAGTPLGDFAMSQVGASA